MNVQVVIPGTVIGSSHEYSAGSGTFEINEQIVAALYGHLQMSKQITSTCCEVVPFKVQNDVGLSVGDVVICRVLRILSHQVTAEILYCTPRTSTTSKKLRHPANAIIRREDSRLSEIDKVVMSELFLPGDLVRANVLSLGDSRQYFLSTADVAFGVCVAKHASSGRLMVPVSWKVGCVVPFLFALLTNL